MQKYTKYALFGAPRLLTINFISKKSSKYIEKHVKNM